jgi:hypothetical protein
LTKCFVIQPFDDGKFDKRYDDVFAPAIKSAGLEPYRVDRDPSVSMPIEDIQSGLESSAACLADISTDNPNVWFELGYAIAARREVILVCSNERTSRFPFDVQHRAIIKYATDSSSDFDDLRTKIQSRITATLQRQETLGQVTEMSPLVKVEGLQQHHIAVLVILGEELHGEVGVNWIQNAMDNAGFTKIATALSLRTLLERQMVASSVEEDINGQYYTVYSITDTGMKWLVENQHILTLKQEIDSNSSPRSRQIPG